MMNISRVCGVVCVGLFVFVINTPTNAAAYRFTKIFDSNDPLPNGMGNFTDFSLPSLDGRNVAFAGEDGSNTGPFGSFVYRYSGVYTIMDGNLNLVADSNNPIPGGVGNFEWLTEPVIDGNNVAFAGGDRATDQNGIYTDIGGNVRVVADLNTPVPGGTDSFSFIPDEDFGISNGVVALTGYEVFPGASGVYADTGGNLSVIADQNTPTPDGSGDFGAGGYSGMNGGDVAFSGRTLAAEGLYLNSGGTINTVIDTNTQIPGTNNTFEFITHELLDVANGTYVIVEGPDNAQLGLYSNVEGALHLIAEIGDLSPDGIGAFTFFDNLAVDVDEVAFTAVEDNINGNIFRYAAGTLDEVIGVGDLLDGKTITFLQMWDAGFDASAIAFQVDFADGSSGIYLAEVEPVPSTPVDLSGTIKTVGGTDICAMVLASGQFMFSCNPPGVFSIEDLPREVNGSVKRQIYADGFFPKIDILSGSSNDVVVMERSGTCPSYNAPYDAGVFPGSAGKRIGISGAILLQNSQTPICAMVLANGQFAFTCDGTGSYSLNIPLDNNGQYKLQVYAQGFAPLTQRFDEFSANNDVRMARATECQ